MLICLTGKLMVNLFILIHAVHLKSAVPIIISPNEVFCDIMVLALPRPPPPHPPIDPDNVSTLTEKIFNGSLSNCL